MNHLRRVALKCFSEGQHERLRSKMSKIFEPLSPQFKQINEIIKNTQHYSTAELSSEFKVIIPFCDCSG